MDDLFSEIENGNIEKVKELIDAVADINAKDEAGFTALHYASKQGHTDIVKMLIEAGADVNEKKRPHLYTPLHYAVMLRQKKIIDLLIDANADVNARDNWECTPLHYVFRCDEKIVKFLIDAGADVDARDCNWETPLHFASKKGYTEIAKLLIESGASIFALDKKMRYPITLAFDDNNIELIIFIVDKMNKRKKPINGEDARLGVNWLSFADVMANKKQSTRRREMNKISIQKKDEKMPNKKYKLGESKQFGELTLHRVVALRDFGDVKAGDVGGWVESENNLSHEGTCWVYDEAQVYGGARVLEYARVFQDSEVYGNAKVFGFAKVYGNAEVCGKAMVFGMGTMVFGDAEV